jgi:hypothetical protein
MTAMQLSEKKNHQNSEYEMHQKLAQKTPGAKLSQLCSSYGLGCRRGTKFL